MDDKQLRVLLVEDDEDDYLLTRDLFREIKGSRFDLAWVRTPAEALKAIAGNDYDVCLLDHNLGECTGLELLREMLAKGCKAPIIMLTGQGDYGIDVEAMTAGAADYLVKGQVGVPLLERSIRYAIQRAQALETVRQLNDQLANRVAELEAAQAQIRQLRGLLPICAYCKSIRNDQNYWQNLENYISEHADVQFSHGICPNCLEEVRKKEFPQKSNPT